MKKFSGEKKTKSTEGGGTERLRLKESRGKGPLKESARSKDQCENTGPRKLAGLTAFELGPPIYTICKTENTRQ